MRLYTGGRSGFAINLADALSWHDVPQAVAGLAERSGFAVRANGERRIWQVWATAAALADIQSQGEVTA